MAAMATMMAARVIFGNAKRRFFLFVIASAEAEVSWMPRGFHFHPAGRDDHKELFCLKYLKSRRSSGIAAFARHENTKPLQRPTET